MLPNTLTDYEVWYVGPYGYWVRDATYTLQRRATEMANWHRDRGTRAIVFELTRRVVFDTHAGDGALTHDANAV